MTFGGNNFNDFPEIVPTREITTKIKKTFFRFFRPWQWAYFLNGPNASSSIALTLFKSSSASSMPNSTHTGGRCGAKNLKIAPP